MSKYKKQIKQILKDKTLSNDEKQLSLAVLLEELIYQNNLIQTELKTDYLEKSNKKSKIQAYQFMGTLASTALALWCATNTANNPSLANDITLAVSGILAIGGFGYMTLEELGVPFFKDDKLAKKMHQLEQASQEIKDILYESENFEQQMQ